MRVYNIWVILFLNTLNTSNSSSMYFFIAWWQLPFVYLITLSGDVPLTIFCVYQFGDSVVLCCVALRCVVLCCVVLYCVVLCLVRSVLCCFGMRCGGCIVLWSGVVGIVGWCTCVLQISINTLMSSQNDRHLIDIFKLIFLCERSSNLTELYSQRLNWK